jgi:hypothetical protein
MWEHKIMFPTPDAKYPFYATALAPKTQEYIILSGM